MTEYKTYNDYLLHPEFKKVRTVAMEKAKHVCQNCFKKKATQVHHLEYPKWGEFDIPENLLPVCYSCHCKIHGKDE